MIYRCGWAQKENQERVLAISIKKNAFDALVRNAVASIYPKNSDIFLEQWQQSIKRSDIKVQWDPERDILGNPLDYRCIRLGIRGETVKAYVSDYIVRISDITDYVKELYEKKKQWY